MLLYSCSVKLNGHSAETLHVRTKKILFFFYFYHARSLAVMYLLKQKKVVNRGWVIQKD